MQICPPGACHSCTWSRDAQRPKSDEPGGHTEPGRVAPPLHTRSCTKCRPRAPRTHTQPKCATTDTGPGGTRIQSPKAPARGWGAAQFTHPHTPETPARCGSQAPPLPTRMLICLAKGFLVFLFGSSDDQIKAGRTYAHPQAPPTKSRPPPRSPPQGPGAPQIKQGLQRPTTLKPTGSAQRPQAPAPGAPDHWVPT